MAQMREPSRGTAGTSRGGAGRGPAATRRPAHWMNSLEKQSLIQRAGRRSAARTVAAP
ncbi:hypothetical protein [Amycolatopsis taiwanensis]|uniref:hypothetical protein n=1 Tax=Amycolatopsis taiwanensis TaxID=342230 RepID=UPI0012EBA04B|nr:hypothetical protein [Amycolatopsis taiwanensis]